jgi:hypothetical protein
METTLIKKIMQQAGKAICLSILALAMANCTNSQDVTKAQETADKAKEEAQEAKKEAEKVKEEADKKQKDLEARITALEAAGPLADAVKIQNDITALKTAVGDVNSGLVKAVNEKANKADVYTKAAVYTKQQAIGKINELNTKIFNARDDMNTKFTVNPIAK